MNTEKHPKKTTNSESTQPEKIKVESENPEFSVLYFKIIEKERANAVIEREITQVRHQFFKESEALHAIREEAISAPDLKNQKESYDQLNRLNSDADATYFSYRNTNESFEDFARRAEVSEPESELYHARRYRDETRTKVKAARKEFEAAIDSHPEVAAQKLRFDDLANQIEFLENQVDSIKKEISRLKEIGDREYLVHGMQRVVAQQRKILKEKRAEWRHIDSETTGYVLENASFNEPRVVEALTGTIYIAVDAGVPKDPAHPEPNEDRVFIKHQGEKVELWIIDGIGGYGQGSLAAEILARTAQENADEYLEPVQIQRLASDEMIRVGLKKDGACYAAARIEGNQLNISSAGDVRINVYRNGECILSTIDEGHLNVVENAVSGLDAGSTQNHEFSLEPGDVVAGYTDGITDQYMSDSYLNCP
jgi:hypothetical protein